MHGFNTDYFFILATLDRTKKFATEKMNGKANATQNVRSDVTTR
ncbi:hypothetical protein F926_03200 [Acinetobacter haemolyticus NIPH 261]|nr:hypothetical protein F926_03200 [Acinetobacter haemolyticus NIPH 261]